MNRSVLGMCGLPVLCLNGVRLGVVRDAIFDPFEQRVLALKVEWEGDQVLASDTPLPLSQIAELDADIVNVATEIGSTSGLEFADQADRDGLLEVSSQMIGLPVVGPSGAPLGQISDLSIDPEDGSVYFYEIGPPNGADFSEGPQLLAPHQALDFQERRLVIPPAAMAGLGRPKEHMRIETMTLLEENGQDDRVGEDDVEVLRSQTNQPG